MPATDLPAVMPPVVLRVRAVGSKGREGESAEAETESQAGLFETARGPGRTC